MGRQHRWAGVGGVVSAALGVAGSYPHRLFRPDPDRAPGNQPSIPRAAREFLGGNAGAQKTLCHHAIERCVCKPQRWLVRRSSTNT